MKRLIMILASIFLVLIPSKATNIPLDSIKSSMLVFLNNVESYDDNDMLPNLLIRERKKGHIKEGMEGVFSFAPFITSARLHYLLIEKNAFQFLNTREPIDLNISKLLDFLERNKYSKRKIIFYIRELIQAYRYNEENMRRFILDGAIK